MSAARRAGMIVAIVVVGAIAAANMLSRRGDEAPAAVAPDAAPAAATKPRTPAPAPAPASATVFVPPPAPPGAWLPANEVRDLGAAAAAGDADAMLRVGRALRDCVEHLADPDGEALRADYERALARLGADDTPADSPAYLNTESRFAHRFATHASCQELGAERVATGLSWIEGAARAGHVKAKVEFARQAFAEFDDRNALLANLDEVIRRRDLARAWARQALEAGEPGAVDVLVDAYYGETPLYPRDYRQGAPYAMAQEMIRTRRVDADAFRRLYEHGPPRDAYGWGEHNAWVRDDAAWQEALERARAIVDRVPPDPPRPPPRPPG